MKIQCSCGAKYSFEITPGMQPVKFVCQSCGQDYSAYVNDLIRKELGEEGQTVPAISAAPPPALAIASAATPAAQAAPPPPPETGVPRLRISRPQHEAASQEQAPLSKYCERHRTELTTDHCQVCKKPICPQCLQTFGPYCSAFCKNKVEGPRMTAPLHVGAKFAAQRQFWRKTGMISGVAGTVIVLAFGFWIWYAWIGSVPHKWFSVKWDDISHTGNSWVVGGDQLVFLHGGTLARYNLKTKQPVWSLDLVTKQQIDDAIAQAKQEGDIEIPRLLEKDARIGLEQQLTLEGSGKNIWIAQGNALTHYDWDSGKVLQQVTITNDIEGELTGQGDEFMGVGHTADGAEVVTRVNMDDGTVHTDQFTPAGAPAAGQPPMVAQNAAPRRAARGDGGGLPLNPNGDDTRPMNPQRVAEQAQGMSLPGRIALPALLASSEHQRAINREMRAEDQSNEPRRAVPARAAGTQPPDDEDQFANQDVNLVPDGDTYIAFAVHMVQQNMVSREAMKAPPAHSALDSPNLSTANENEAVNEQLNEMQRNNGNDKVIEDQSRYQVAIRRLSSPQPDWIGEVVGPPQFFALKTMNVVAAGKTIIVFDKSNKMLWQAQLSYPVTGGDVQAGERANSQYGQGPCVEHNGTLYVFDQAVLTAFDPAGGNVRWRIPSVGVVGLFFDDKGFLYANTTTGNPDDIRYSRQIDVNKETDAVVIKVDPASGATLWTVKPGGYISYLSGKFIYAWNSYDPGDKEDELSDAADALQKPAFFRIIRINPANGHNMWQYDDDRAPVDVKFDQNIISIVLKKEVEVMRFFTL